MEYQEFFERVKRDLKEWLPEKLQNAEIGERQVDKLQGESYQGIEIKPEGSPAALTMDLRTFYGNGVEENDYPEILDRITEVIMENAEFPSRNMIEKMSNYAEMRGTLTFQAVGKEGNEEILQHVPYRHVEDLALVYRFQLDKTDDTTTTVLVTDRLMKEYGITEEQLYEDTCRNMVEKDDMVIKPIYEMMAELAGIPVSEIPEEAMIVPLYVATNQARSYGAAVLGHPDFTETAAEMLGGDFFIFPSSVHELLLLPDDGTMELEYMEEMVKEINATKVEPKERLSNTVYHFDAEAGLLESAREFQKRIRIERQSVLEELREKKRTLPEKAAEKPNMHRKKEIQM